MLTRNDLKISTCGLLLEAVAEDGVLDWRVEVDVLRELADRGGSRSLSGAGVVAERMGREERGAGVGLRRVSRSPTMVEPVLQVDEFGQLGVVSWSRWALRGRSERLKERAEFWFIVE